MFIINQSSNQSICKLSTKAIFLISNPSSLLDIGISHAIPSVSVLPLSFSTLAPIWQRSPYHFAFLMTAAAFVVLRNPVGYLEPPVVLNSGHVRYPAPFWVTNVFQNVEYASCFPFQLFWLFFCIYMLYLG